MGSGQPRYIYPYILEGNIIKLPFAYATGIKVPRPEREQFSTTNLSFIGKLRTEAKSGA